MRANPPRPPSAATNQPKRSSGIEQEETELTEAEGSASIFRLPTGFTRRVNPLRHSV